MKNLPKWMTTVTPVSTVIAAVLFVSLPFIGYFLGIASVPQTTTVITSKNTNASPQQTYDPTKNGIIEVALSYPSEGIPNDIQICARNTVSGIPTCNSTVTTNTQKYRYNKGIILTLPEGKYEVYAKTLNMKPYYFYTNRGKVCAEYDNVNNGLIVENDACTNFKDNVMKLEVDVKMNKPQFLGTGIDWYKDFSSINI